ncbi:MAG: thermostable hemolysin [Colwellia sp.]|nr:thermostable hemolysin [Colwellia sp.]
MLIEPEMNSCANQVTEHLFAKAVTTQQPVSKTTQITQSFSMDVFSQNSIGRVAAEQFIKQGFKKTYRANISISMPQVLTVNTGKFKAALGIRSAKSPLFIEQYLPCPIEKMTALVNENIPRESIVEIGCLYSNANRFTIPLFIVTAISLFYQGYSHLVFSGTEKVLNIISKAEIDATHLCDAKQSLLTPSSDDWGSYYETQPKVTLIALSSVIKTINKQPRYQKLFNSLDIKIAHICKKLEICQC